MAVGLLAQRSVGQFEPTLNADSHLIVGAAVVGRTGVESQLAMILRVASSPFDERFLM